MHTEDEIISSLDPAQREAVLQTDGPVLIIAGAGSGKTRVLTSRIALLLQRGESAEDILALTFTKKAAGEMRYRVKKMVGDLVKGISIGTFHSVFIKCLRVYHERLGYPEDFTIYDESDTESCLKACVGEVLFGPDWNNKEKIKAMTEDERRFRKELFKKYSPHDIRGIISLAKNGLVMPDDYRHDGERMRRDQKHGRGRLAEIYDLYVKKCFAAGAMDFDDILVNMHRLLVENLDVKADMAFRCRYILVDEYQDTNALQYSIIRMLASGHGNITVVGDDSQSIYAFRGARIENIIGFQDDYPSLKLFRLETNYRSTNQIVDAANRLIAHNEGRIPKTCHASRGDGAQIDVIGVDSDRDEARFVAEYIQAAVKGGARWRDFAVLYRTNAQSRIVEDVFIKSHIPYLIFSGLSFFDRAEVKDAIAYMRLVLNPNDNEAFKRICNRPARGISDATLSALEAKAAVYNGSLIREAQRAEPGELGVKDRACKSLREFAELVYTLNREIDGKDAVEAVNLIFEQTGILEFYRGEAGEDGLKKSNNLKELLNSVCDFILTKKQEWEEDIPDGPLQIGLREYLEDISLLSNADTKGFDGNSVCIMTSHCSKGLEFKTVFIIGVEKGLFPLIRDDLTPFEEEEERRLFYVSVTRAMDKLILTHCGRRWRFGDVDDAVLSPFIEEMELEQNEYGADVFPNSPLSPSPIGGVYSPLASEDNDEYEDF